MKKYISIDKDKRTVSIQIIDLPMANTLHLPMLAEKITNEITIMANLDSRIIPVNSKDLSGSGQPADESAK